MDIFKKYSQMYSPCMTSAPAILSYFDRHMAVSYTHLTLPTIYSV